MNHTATPGARARQDQALAALAEARGVWEELQLAAGVQARRRDPSPWLVAVIDAAVGVCRSPSGQVRRIPARRPCRHLRGAVSPRAGYLDAGRGRMECRACFDAATAALAALDVDRCNVCSRSFPAEQLRSLSARWGSVIVGATYCAGCHPIAWGEPS